MAVSAPSLGSVQIRACGFVDGGGLQATLTPCTFSSLASFVESEVMGIAPAHGADTSPMFRAEAPAGHVSQEPLGSSRSVRQRAGRDLCRAPEQGAGHGAAWI